MPVDVLAHTATILKRGYSTGWPFARRRDGSPCHPNDPRAAAWSLHGALMRSAHELQLEHVLQSARLAACERLWDVHRIALAWAELDPRMSIDLALDSVESTNF